VTVRSTIGIRDRRSVLATCAAVAWLVAGACSGDDSSSGGPPLGTGAVTSAAPDAPRADGTEPLPVPDIGPPDTRDGPPSPDELDPPPPPPSVCELLDIADVGEVTGTAVTGSEGGTDPSGRDFCVTIDDAGTSLVRIRSTPAGAEATAAYGDLASAAGAEPLPELGETAVSAGAVAALLGATGLLEIAVLEGAGLDDTAATQAAVTLLGLAVA
jgi:hypothetical protein